MDPKNELKSIVDSGRIPNSLLFQGPSGAGKLKAAIEFAHNVIGLNNHTKSKIVETISHPDLHIVFPIPSSEKKQENNCDYYINDWRELVLQTKFNPNLQSWSETLETNKQPIINIDIVRHLSKKLSLSSFASGYKVILFWMADRLNEEASNKLLKLVEEPGKKTVFIFMIEKNKALIKTLDSRCQKINFLKLGSNDIIKNNSYEEIFSELTRNAFLAKTKKESLLKLSNWSQNMSKMDREDIKGFLIYSNEIFRQAFFKNIGLDQYVVFKPTSNFSFEGFSKYVTNNNIEPINILIEQSHYNIKRNANSKMVMMNLAFDLTKLIHS